MLPTRHMPTLRGLYEALPWRRERRERVAGNAAILSSGSNGDSAPASQYIEASARAPSPVPTKLPRPHVTGDEYGASGTENFGGYIRREDFNPDLDTFTSAVRIYDKMKRGDAQIRAMLSVLKLPLRGATWTALAPDKGDLVDQAIADYVNSCLFEDDAMEFSWDYTLRHILLQLEYGFACLEKVWKVDDEGAYRLLRLAPRLARTILMWHVDRHGRLKAVIQWAPVVTSTTGSIGRNGRASMNLPGAGTNGTAIVTPPLPHSTSRGSIPLRYSTTVSFQELVIPAEYCAVFTLDREGDNYEGIPVLRTIYRNWFYKDQAYHLEGVRLDRWGVGIPVAKLQEGHTLTQQDLDELVDVLKKVRANERAFLIAPPNVDYDLMPKTGSQSAGSGAMAWIDHHDAQIVRNVLAGFLTMGQDPHGTLGFGSRLTDMFISSLNGVAQGICADLKQQVVRQLCDLNFDMTKRQYPRVTCRDLEQVDMDNLIKALVAFTGSELVQADDDTEKLLRKMLQLPPLTAEMSRKNKSDAKQGTAAAENASVDPNAPPPGAPAAGAGGAPGVEPSPEAA